LRTWTGAIITFKITLLALVFGILWGTVLALLRLSGIKPLEWFAKGYVTLFRSIPLVMVLLWFFLIVPQFLQNVLGLSAEVDIRLASAMVAFSLFEAAYYSEIIRAGIQAVSRGQVNAAFALGMTYMQAMKLIILPQAFRAMVPLIPDKQPGLSSKSVFISAGSFDPIVPTSQTKQLAELLRDAGADVTVRFLQSGHELMPDDVDLAREWLRIWSSDRKSAL